MEGNSEDQSNAKVSPTSEGITPSMKINGKIRRTGDNSTSSMRDTRKSVVPKRAATGRNENTLDLASNLAAIGLIVAGGYIVYRMVRGDNAISIKPTVIPPLSDVIEIVGG